MLVVSALVAGTLSVAAAADDSERRSDDVTSELTEERTSEGASRGRRRVGNAIFIHPDGTGLSFFHAGRLYWEGADESIEWDRLPEMAAYRGHMSDQLVGTSNGGATAHAFGVKVQGPDSYGTDRGRDILALSGYPGSILREAANHGHPVGVVNDGDVNGEPGTGAFLTETDNRNQAEDHALQLLGGRPGFDGDTPDDITDGETDPVVVLGGGERFFLPAELMADDSGDGRPDGQCTTAPTLDDPQLDCFVHLDPVNGRGPGRSDGRNLLQEAAEDGWIVIRTRAEFDELMARLADDPRYAPKVLGLFAADDIVNDEEEEQLRDAGLVRDPGDPLPPEGERAGRIVGWGAKFDDPDRPFSFDPPTAAELSEMALLILDRRSRVVERKPFALVIEVESTDNFPNKNNAIGTLRALRRADEVIGVARDFEQREGEFELPRRRRDRGRVFDSMIITAADSDASGMQVLAVRPPTTDTPFNPITCLAEPDPNPRSVCEESGGTVSFTTVNPQFSSSGPPSVNVDGIEGWNTPPFVAAPDALLEHRPFPDEDESGLGSFGGGTIGQEPLQFAVAWTSAPDAAGGILTRAQGLNARLLRSHFSERFDNTDVYRMMYLTVFGELLPSGVGVPAADRP